MDWVEIVSEQEELAKRLAGEIPPMLASDSATRAEIERLWKVMERQCAAAEELVENLHDAGTGQSLINAAESMEAIFLDLHAALGKKLYRVGRSAVRDCRRR